MARSMTACRELLEGLASVNLCLNLGTVMWTRPDPSLTTSESGGVGQYMVRLVGLPGMQEVREVTSAEAAASWLVASASTPTSTGGAPWPPTARFLAATSSLAALLSCSCWCRLPGLPALPCAYPDTVVPLLVPVLTPSLQRVARTGVLARTGVPPYGGAWLG